MLNIELLLINSSSRYLSNSGLLGGLPALMSSKGSMIPCQAYIPKDDLHSLMQSTGYQEQ